MHIAVLQADQSFASPLSQAFLPLLAILPAAFTHFRWNSAVITYRPAHVTFCHTLFPLLKIALFPLLKDRLITRGAIIYVHFCLKNNNIKIGELQKWSF